MISMLQTCLSSPLAWIAAAVLLVFVAWLVVKRQGKRERVAGVVSSIYLYPVKSCSGIPLKETWCTVNGQKYDRRWIVVDKENRIVNQKLRPSMTLIRVNLSVEESGEAVLSLNAPGMVELSLSPISEEDKTEENALIVSNQKIGFDCGKEVAEWFSTYLELEGCRLCYLEKFSGSKRPSKPRMIAKLDEFAPYLVVSEASMEDLNSRIGENLSIIRFRPNIIVKNTDAKPYEEDSWQFFQIAKAVFEKRRLCVRCLITTVDPDTGKVSGVEPMATLKTYRKEPESHKPSFGSYVKIVTEGLVAIGDQVTVFEK